MKKFKGSGLLIMTVVSAAIIGLISVSIAQLHSTSLNSLYSSNIILQARQYAESRVNHLSLQDYNDIKNQGKTQISGTKFKDSITVGSETNNNGLKSKVVTVDVFYDNEVNSRAQLSKIFYANNSSHYVLNDKSPDTSLSLDYVNSRYIAKASDFDEQKLLTNKTQQYSGNLNNLVETGFFNGSNLGNAPDSDWYYIENIRHSNMSNFYINQRITNFNNNKIYNRQCRNGSWSGWEELGNSSGSGGSWITIPASGTAPSNGLIVVTTGWNGSITISTSGIQRVAISGRSKYGQGYESATCPVAKGERYSVSGGIASIYFFKI